MRDIRVRILGISGTPVKGGNCDRLVKESLKAAKQIGNVETEFVTLADKKIAMCQHCQHCIKKRSGCKIHDDAQAIYEKISKSDGVILGSPAWFRTVAPPIPILFSRSRNIVFFSHEFRNKICGTISVSWFGRGMENTMAQLKLMAERFMMIPVAEGSAISSTVAFGKRADFLEHGALDHMAGVKSVRKVGYRVAEIARMIKFATEAGVTVSPEYQVTGTGATLRRQSEG